MIMILLPIMTLINLVISIGPIILVIRGFNFFCMMVELLYIGGLVFDQGILK